MLAHLGWILTIPAWTRWLSTLGGTSKFWAWKKINKSLMSTIINIKINQSLIIFVKNWKGANILYTWMLMYSVTPFCRKLAQSACRNKMYNIRRMLKNFQTWIRKPYGDPSEDEWPSWSSAVMSMNFFKLPFSSLKEDSVKSLDWNSQQEKYGMILNLRIILLSRIFALISFLATTLAFSTPPLPCNTHHLISIS